jgi:hypothetical protein
MPEGPDGGRRGSEWKLLGVKKPGAGYSLPCYDVSMTDNQNLSNLPTTHKLDPDRSRKGVLEQPRLRVGIFTSPGIGFVRKRYLLFISFRDKTDSV